MSEDPPFFKVDKAFKDVGITIEARDKIYEFIIDDVGQYLLNNVIINLYKGIWEMDSKRFVNFVKNNYFKEETLQLTLTLMTATLSTFCFTDENKNDYLIEVFYNYPKNNLSISMVYSYKNKIHYRDYNKPAYEGYYDNKPATQMWYKNNKICRYNDKLTGDRFTVL